MSDSVFGAVVGADRHGRKLISEEAAYLPGTRKRTKRVATLPLNLLSKFRLAAVTLTGECFWWTSQLACSPIEVASGWWVLSFVPVYLDRELIVSEWRLVDDEGYLIRARRVGEFYPEGFRVAASYKIAMDGSDRKT